MNRLLRFWRSTIGKKVAMAITGAILVGFLISHVLANLLILTGKPDGINAYAAFLRTQPPLLWGGRLVLLGAVILHVIAAVQLTRLDRAARPVGYTRNAPQTSTFASRTIRWGGLLILLFVIYHILHFTTGAVHPDFVHGDPYRNVIVGFDVKWVAAFYIVAMVAVGLHLYHGTWSAFRTLGLVQPSANPLKRRVATVLAIGIWLGFTLIPVAVITGMVR
jgi:succinate dehydrogenase / fumarate reductase cytochrome b subunit